MLGYFRFSSILVLRNLYSDQSSDPQLEFSESPGELIDQTRRKANMVKSSPNGVVSMKSFKCSSTPTRTSSAVLA